MQAWNNKVKTPFITRRNRNVRSDEQSFDIPVRDVTTCFSEDLPPSIEPAGVSCIEPCSIICRKNCMAMSIDTFK